MSKVKNKERILKAAREKQIVTYKGKPIRLIAEFSAEILQVRSKGHEILKGLKKEKLPTKNMLPGNVILQI